MKKNAHFIIQQTVEYDDQETNDVTINNSLNTMFQGIMLLKGVRSSSLAIMASDANKPLTA